MLRPGYCLLYRLRVPTAWCISANWFLLVQLALAPPARNTSRGAPQSGQTESGGEGEFFFVMLVPLDLYVRTGFWELFRNKLVLPSWLWLWLLSGEFFGMTSKRHWVLQTITWKSNQMWKVFQFSKPFQFSKTFSVQEKCEWEKFRKRVLLGK